MVFLKKFASVYWLLNTALAQILVQAVFDNLQQSKLAKSASQQSASP
jgi:hypothetical protein